jgi:hypothetical protein
VLKAHKNAQNSELLNGAKIIFLEKELTELHQKQSQKIFCAKRTPGTLSVLHQNTCSLHEYMRISELSSAQKLSERTPG